MENYFKQKIITIYSDNGGEYQALTSFLALHGISHLTTPPHTLKHNGYSERRHHHIVKTGLYLLSHASIPYPIGLMPLPQSYTSSIIFHSHTSILVPIC